jgi:hypothetical protein
MASLSGFGGAHLFSATTFQQELGWIKREILAEEAQGFRQQPTTKPKSRVTDD